MRLISTRLMPRVCGSIARSRRHSASSSAADLRGISPSRFFGFGSAVGCRGAPFLCSNGLLPTCPDRNRTNLIGIALYGVAAMAGPKTPRELADRMRDHRAQHRARDGFVRETFTQPRDDPRQKGREFLDRYPQPATHNFLTPRCTGSYLGRLTM